MACRTVQLPGGGFAIVCGRTRRQACRFCGVTLGATALLCDWKLTGAKAGKTCDAPMCRKCAAAVGEDKDLCPPHAKVWAADPRNQANTAPATDPA